MTGARAAAVLGAALCLAGVADPADRLADPAKEARARSLFREIRCLVCQGESIDESEAPLAGDLRKRVREEVEIGMTNGQIRAWLTARYGPFVLLRPSFSLTNAVLWGAPFAVAAIGVGVLILRRRREDAGGELSGELSAEEETRIAALAPTFRTDLPT
ncbi:MAG: cytochrome c-type biogenesis protein [Caulobacteraceae bacterium]